MHTQTNNSYDTHDKMQALTRKVLVVLVILLVPAVFLNLIVQTEPQQQPQPIEIEQEEQDAPEVDHIQEEIHLSPEQEQHQAASETPKSHEKIKNLWDIDLQTTMRLHQRLPPESKSKAKKESSQISPTFKDNLDSYFQKFQSNIEVSDLEEPLTSQLAQKFSIKMEEEMVKRKDRLKQLANYWQDEQKDMGVGQWANVDQEIKKEQVSRALRQLQLMGSQWNEQNNQKKDKRLVELQSQERAWARKDFGVSGQSEIPMCVVVTSHNNIQNLRVVWNAQSVLQQDYSNYKLIFIDDGSTDGNWQVLDQYLKWRRVNPEKVKYFRTKNRVYAMENIYYAAHKYCSLQSVLVLIGGDDELIGRQVFSRIDSLYRKDKLYVLYSNHLVYWGEKGVSPLTIGTSSSYTNYVKKGELFRDARLGGHGHLHTLMTDLFIMTADSSLMQNSTHFYQHSAVDAIMASALQLSCGRYSYLPELLYLKNANTIQSEKAQDLKSARELISKGGRYRCAEQLLGEVQ